ncbi:SDR family NAD(P)-dependent oxidoreductase [Herbaspirillum sp. LeCh32-8]|uniref:oxidoreductase n=1 Tax=Herbaspirillum sp. LeCh32-8 TaxID=2821356 RepID=UPI001AE30837|nr:oxidoreductase [Herbaspirillum sp. LeCh32-8]MBP0597157.1 SDR family NAD(P)-dependent oxidoreductase [Herbaspirillum sp. LeCh32-8]
MTQQVWFITGSANGLGRDITEAALAAGHQVVAAARTPAQLAELVQRYPGQLLPVALDVTDRPAIGRAVGEALQGFGRIDVLVNNAGYGQMLPFEQMDNADFRAQIDTNFYGVVDVTRAVLPTMRERRSGHIINVSSVGGRIGVPGMSAYQSAKWAVGGFTEVLAMETAPLGIKVTAIEPGGMRTNWAQRARGNAPQVMPDYEESVGAWMKQLAGVAGNEHSDPARVAQVVLKLAAHPAPPMHLMLGEDALHFYTMIEEQRVQAAERWRQVTTSTGYSELPVPELPAH